MKIFSGFLIIAVCLIFAGCGTETATDDYEGPPFYFLVLSADAGDGAYENDELIKIDSGGMGRSMIFVNDSPVQVVGYWGDAFAIDDFVVPGKNTIRVEGARTGSSYMKVLLVDSDTTINGGTKCTEVVAKCRFDPEAETSTLEFDVPETFQPSAYEEFAQDEALQKELDKQIEEYITTIVQYFRDLDLEGLNEFNGEILKMKDNPPSRLFEARYNGMLAAKKENEETYCNQDLKLDELNFDRKKIRIHKGPRSIFICRDIDDSFGSRHLLECKVTNQDDELTFFHVTRILLIKINGKLYRAGRGSTWW